MQIEVTYNREELVTQEELIPYETENKPSSQLEKGVTQVAQEGQNGVNELTYKVSYVNGDEVSRELVSTTEKSAPVTRIVEYGTKTSSPTVAYSGGTVSRSGDLRYKTVINATATAYCLTGRTASGMYTQPGVVAVDPNVIPLGTRLYIEAADGSWTYGNAVAADTGGAIKGNKVDLYMTTADACYQFGRRAVKVYILE
jgi:3D (Asp-Asp-Asp) domain-containing protein